MTTIAETQARVYALALKKGWWGERDADGKLPPLTTDEVLASLALIHSEVSEATEEARRVAVADLAVSHVGDGKPEGVGVELADAVIRIMSLCGRLGIDLDAEIEAKYEYNRTRPFRHGGRLA